ncbi:5-oxopent-3-ene-1,2,5-tricarboxylate decarboxylase [Caballeronia udeis]|uniref:5-oxopent-3-ene-1,2,5-tricarboxylate decarboxylase n=1 Tax=Caballeronia udeis TaxID=1232866 RepID=A0A158JQ44_9BURK|nr:fumarylacetoacetate hydrolase family protein [Caballeronia udeis]SAL70551.1 5-oxopent-3-ene-1,2,5-tricarboxylate decarboxylase [Caballeronia udeis]
MKLVTFSRHQTSRVGLITGTDELVDLSESGVAANMNDLIDRYDTLKASIEKCVAETPKRLRLADVKLLAPIPNVRRNVFCVGKNYFDHAQEFSSSGFDSSAARGAVPSHPIIFSKPPSSVSGPGDAIDTALDPYDSVDYEAELAVVIGKQGRVSADDDPWSFVFGITLVNDVTSREAQKIHSQWLLGKGPDGYCPMGPAIVTMDDIRNVSELKLECFVNGELRQSAFLKDLIFDIPTLIRTIGRSISLQPGDVIATGTPAGVGLGFSPPKYLKSGDTVSVVMEPVGRLDNVVI